MKKLLVWFLFLGCLVACNREKIDLNKEEKNSLRERVIASGVIRAGYTIYYPGCFKDENGKLKGVFVETLEKAASELNLKVEWVEEVGWATQIEGLNTNKYDMIGSSVWTNPKRAKNASLSIPLYYSPLYLYTRANETKFDGFTDYSQFNSSDYIFSLVDGGTGEVIYKNSFSNARKISLPESTDFGTSFLDLKSNKADIVIQEPYQATKFSIANPDQIKALMPNKPIKIFGNAYMFKLGEVEFQGMLNVVLTDLINNGYVDNLLTKYEGKPNTFVRVASDYNLGTK